MDADLRSEAAAALDTLSGRCRGAGVRVVVDRQLSVRGDSLAREERSEIWLRAGARWTPSAPGRAASDASRAPTDDERALATEEPRRAALAPTPDPLPSDDDARELASAAGDDTHVWLQRQELWLEDDGSSVAQSRIWSWSERPAGGTDWVVSMNGEQLAAPPGRIDAGDLDPDATIIALPTAALSLAVAVAVRLRADTGLPRLGRQTIASRAITMERIPRGRGYDAEGVEQRFQPLIVRGIAVGALSDRRSAASARLSRSSGSAMDGGATIGPGVDTVSLRAGRDGHERELLAGLERALIIDGPLSVSQLEDGVEVFAPVAREARAGAISARAGSLRFVLPGADPLRRVVAVGSHPSAVAIRGTRALPITGSAPPLALHPLRSNRARSGWPT